jgi:hypothetical protein
MSDDCVINRQPHHPAFWLYAFHIKQKSFFCMREETKQSLVVKAFIKSNKRDDIIEIKPNKKAIKTCLDRALNREFFYPLFLCGYFHQSG